METFFLQSRVIKLYTVVQKREIILCPFLISDISVSFWGEQIMLKEIFFFFLNFYLKSLTRLASSECFFFPSIEIVVWDKSLFWSLNSYAAMQFSVPIIWRHTGVLHSKALTEEDGRVWGSHVLFQDRNVCAVCTQTSSIRCSLQAVGLRFLWVIQISF